jgi:predicted flap endonuclease-1-like 5' DNA nuclease
MQRRIGNEPVTASGELRTLLMRAEARAGRDGRTHASLADLIGLIADLSEHGSLRDEQRSAAVSTNSMAAYATATNTRTPEAIATMSPPRRTQAGAASHGDNTRAASQSTRAPPSSEHSMLSQLLARLERLEAEVAEWRSGAKKGVSSRSAPAHAATVPATSRGQTYLHGFHFLSTQSTPDRVYLRRCLRQRKDQNRRRRDRMLAAANRERHKDSANIQSWPHRKSGVGSPNRANRDYPANPAEHDQEDAATTNDTTKRFYLALDDHVERAPSIGPKTAARLVDAGIATVRDLLSADPDELSARVRGKFITSQRLRDWQAQSRLVCTVPFLRGTHAQLLVGAGYQTLDRIVEADPSLLCAAILRFATTRDGQSVLRSAPPPDMERIQRWLQNAIIAEPDRAAA